MKKTNSFGGRSYCPLNKLLSRHILLILLILIMPGIKKVYGDGNPEIMTLQQQSTVTGTIADSQTGEPMPGVNVLVKGTTFGSITDVNGKYSINVPDQNSILVFSFIGYGSQEIPVSGRSVINVILQSDVLSLEEVVVIGYGTQRRVTLTGSVTTANSEFIEARPLTNSTQALQGLKGLYINQAGGQPGADEATIRIRGIGTLNNNNPLVLVDGVEYNLKDVNPNDIESISVLKDAASASIYGNRAANGVILVTTKTGKREKLKVEFNNYVGWQQTTYLPKMVSSSVDYMIARNQASVNEKQSKPYTDAQIEEYRTGNDPAMYSNTDWWDVMFSMAPMYESNLRLSGGTEATTYSFSVGYMNQEGVMLGTDAKKYTINSNVIYKKSDKLEFGAIINGSYWDRHEPYLGVSDVLNYTARSLPIQPNYQYENGQWADVWLVTPGHNVFYHPTALVKEGFGKIKTQRAMVNLYGQYTFPLGIKYKVNFAVTKYDGNTHTFIPESVLFNPKTQDTRLVGKTYRSVENINNNNLNNSFFQTLNWNRRLADHHDINLLLGFSMERFYNSNFDAYIEGFLGNELTELNAGTINKDVGGTSSESRLMSYFGRANYSFADRYLFEFNFRYDGSSRFAKGNRWGFFPSFSLGWRINEEPFMKNIRAISNLKLRASWGQLGNQSISLYSFLNNININQGTTFNNTIVGGSAVTTLSDPDISWEKTTITNIGLDLGLWKNKLAFELDIFDKETTDILARINVPGQVGNLTGPITNLYGMSNKGFEISVSHVNTQGKLTYKLGTSLAYVNNNVDYLAGNIQYTTNSYGNIRVIKEDYPVNSWYLYEALGIFQTDEEVADHAFQHAATSPGDIKYRDLNDDGKIDINDMRVLGRSTPRFTYSFDFSVDYLGFDLSAFFQGVHDIDIYPWHNVSWPLFNGAGITIEHFNNSWTPENPGAKYPRLSLYKRGTQINAMNSTFWLKDASYLRLKNLQLGYKIPTVLTDKIRINMIKVYVNAQNLLTFSKYKVTDPEKNITQQDIFEYPTIKIYSIGCNVTF
ncbi:MAG TPA: TonB-dependent receptor [Bacteroidales bacterium]|nr:TonB-dependent receptor [Bacteroidales bacterium]